MMDYDNPVQPHEFLDLLYGNVPDGALEVTYIAPDGIDIKPHTVIQWRDLPLGAIAPAMPNVHALNQQGYSCYFGVTVRKAAKAPEQRLNKKTGQWFWMQPRGNEGDALCLTALWCDIDMKDFDGNEQSAYQSLLESPIPPSIIVSSGGGWHGYWLLESPLLITDDNRQMIKQTLRGIALYHRCDTKVAELARIMRLPGTVNTKPERGGAICQVVDNIPGRYHYMDFELTYAPYAAPKIPLPTRALSLPTDKHIPKWIEQYLVSGEREGQRNKKLYVYARQLLDNGFSSGEVENILKPRAMADGLPESEIDRTLSSAERAPRGTPTVSNHVQMRMGVADKRGRDLQF
jgi:hypothetical protein